jgi:hypothetical protein
VVRFCWHGSRQISLAQCPFTLMKPEFISNRSETNRRPAVRNDRPGGRHPHVRFQYDKLLASFGNTGLEKLSAYVPAGRRARVRTIAARMDDAIGLFRGGS